MTHQCHTQGCDGAQIAKGRCRKCYYNKWKYGRETKPIEGWRSKGDGEINVMQERISFYRECYENAAGVGCLVRFATAIRECETELRAMKGDGDE